jgi:hypothetical protein
MKFDEATTVSRSNAGNYHAYNNNIDNNSGNFSSSFRPSNVTAYLRNDENNLP